MIVPSVVAVFLNLWFEGIYVVQLQLPKDIRSQYPNNSFYRGITSTYHEPNYDNMEEYVTLAMIIIHIIFSIVWLAIPCCKAEAHITSRTFAIVFTRGNNPFIKNVCGNLTLFGSTILAVAAIIRLNSKFVGWTSFQYTKLGTQYVDSITLMLKPSYSFQLFGFAVAFHAFVVISFIISYMDSSQNNDENNNNYMIFNNNTDNNDQQSDDRSAQIALTDPDINDINDQKLQYLPERNKTNPYRKNS